MPLFVKMICLDSTSNFTRGSCRHQKTEQDIRRQMDQYLTGKNAQYLSDTIITIRNDRYVLPVKAEYKSVLAERSMTQVRQDKHVLWSHKLS